MQTLSMAEYLDLAARNARNIAWAEQFRKPNGWTVITLEEQATCPDDAQITNDERSEIEVYEFCAAPPEKYLLYIKDNSALRAGRLGNVPVIGTEDIATTWTGDRLGTVFMGREYRDSFGGRRVPVTIRAINGRVYHGTYFKSAGDYARVKLAKSAKGKR